MKKCEKCQKEYDDNLRNCPYCGSEFVTDITSADSHNETESLDIELHGNTDEKQNLLQEKNQKHYPKRFANIVEMKF